MMLEMVLAPVFMGGSRWGPPRMIAAIGMGTSFLPPPDSLALVPVMAAMVIHFVLSIVLAVVLALLVSRRGSGAALTIGAVFGLVIYLIKVYGMTALFPLFAMARNWISICAHMMFGAVAVLSYGWVRGSRLH